jgi:hypothetical protein
MSATRLIPALALLLPAPAALLAQQQAQSSVEVELVIAREVVERQPVGATESFPGDIGQLAAWTRVTGAANTTIEHVWRHLEYEFVVSLNIGGSPWRTWSTKVIPPEWNGDWTVEVRDANGTVLATAHFTVGAGH